MSEQDKNKYIGVATLFNNFELKRFIKFYIGLIFFLEIIIFFFVFFCNLNPLVFRFHGNIIFLHLF
jgi:hypothetical protein